MLIPPRPIVDAPPHVRIRFRRWARGLLLSRALADALQPYRGRYVLVDEAVIWLVKLSDRDDDAVRMIPRSIPLGRRHDKAS